MPAPPGGELRPRRAAPNTVDPVSTTELLTRARAGDQRVLTLVLERHRRALRRWAHGRLPRWARDVADTEDLVQDTLVRTFQRIEHFEARGPGALQAYLRQAVLNRIRDELRHHGRQPPVGELDEPETPECESPIEQAIGREALDRYERALASLRPEEREAIIGRVEMGYTWEELAEALGRPSADAARKATERALIRLADAMRRERT